MYRFKETPQELPELVIDALNLFGNGIKQIWYWALLVAMFSLVGPYLIFEVFEVVAGQVHATFNWYALALNIFLSFPGAYCIGMIVRRLFVLGAGHDESVTDSMKRVLVKFPHIYIGLLMTSAFSVVGFMLIFFPGIFFGVIFAFVLPLILLDDYSVIAAFKESWHLVWDNWWRIFAMLLFPMLILVLVAMIPIDTAKFFRVVLHSFVMWFDIPLLMVFMLTMFYDTKLRHKVPLHLKEDKPKSKPKPKKSKS